MPATRRRTEPYCRGQDQLAVGPLHFPGITYDLHRSGVAEFDAADLANEKCIDRQNNYSFYYTIMEKSRLVLASTASLLASCDLLEPRVIATADSTSWQVDYVVVTEGDSQLYPKTQPLSQTGIYTAETVFDSPEDIYSDKPKGTFLWPRDIPRVTISGKYTYTCTPKESNPQQQARKFTKELTITESAPEHLLIEEIKKSLKVAMRVDAHNCEPIVNRIALWGDQEG